MRIQMELLSDAIFGNGLSVPGGEDISVTRDIQGFPYYRGSTLKGVFREELISLLVLQGNPWSYALKEANEVLGEAHDDRFDERKVFFGDLTIPDVVKATVLEETGDDADAVLDAFTHLRTFTALDEDSSVKEGSLRMARCVNRGVTLEGTILCDESIEPLIVETLGFVKSVGTMRNRGFGSVAIRTEGRD